MYNIYIKYIDAYISFDTHAFVFCNIFYVASMKIKILKENIRQK